MSSSAQVVTPESIFSYFKLWTATPFEAGDAPKFSISLVFPKTTDLSQMQAAYDSVLHADFDGALPYGAKAGGFLDGAVRYPQDPWYADKWILSCSQTEDRPPKILDEQNNPIMDKSQMYSGVIGRALISFYGYQGGSKGIGCSIHGVMKIRDGENMGGGSVDAAAAFAAAGVAPAPSAAIPAQATAPVVTQAPAPTPAPATQAPSPAPTPAVATPPPVPAQAPVAAPAHVMTPKANGAPYEAFIEQGWTDQQLIDNGMMVS